jgi:hypothetical protein
MGGRRREGVLEGVEAKGIVVGRNNGTTVHQVELKGVLGDPYMV